MDALPPPEPSPPIAAPRFSYGTDVEGLIPPFYVPSNQLIGEMPPPLRTYFANKKIERPASVEVNGQPNVGSYGAGRVQVARTTDDPIVARHELLHALSAEHPAYRDEPYFYFGRLRQAVASAPQDPYLDALVATNDWPHIFVHLAERVLDDPSSVAPSVRAYFATLGAQ